MFVTDVSEAVWKSTFYGAFVLHRRVDLHAIDAMPGHPTHWLISTQVAARLKKKATDWYGRIGRTLEPLCISDDLAACSAGTLLEQGSAACTRTRCVKTG